MNQEIPAAAPTAAPPPGESILPREVIYRALLIVLACFFVYGPSLTGDWLWDDDSEVTRHTALRRVSGLFEIWAARSSVDYLPVKSTFQWMAYRFLGENPVGWRWLNLLLHTGNCLLLWALLARMRVPLAWIAGLLFALHPLVVGSVAWISELKNTLSLPLFLAAFWFYLKYFERGTPRNWGRAIVFFALSILTKSSGVMFPFVLLLYAWWMRTGGTGNPAEKTAAGLAWSWPKIVATTLPFFAVSLLAGLSTIYFQSTRAIGSETLPLGDAWSRVALSGINSWFYLWQSLVPLQQLPIYPRWEVDPPQWWQFLAWPVWAGLFVFFWTKRHTWGRHAIFGVGFFLLNLAPVLGFVRMSYMRITWASDHLAYLSLLGILALVAALAASCWRRLEPSLQPWFVALGGLALFALLLRSHTYSPVFLNETTMWTYTLERNHEAWQAHSRLSRRLLEAGNASGAAYHVGEARRLRPDLPETHNNYAASLIRRGQLEEAALALQKAVELAPHSDLFRMNLANLYVRRGQHEEARVIYEQLLERNPYHAELLTNYGASLFFSGQPLEAIGQFRRALAIEPNLSRARLNLLEAERAMQNNVPGLTTQRAADTASGVGFLDAEAPLRLFDSPNR